MTGKVFFVVVFSFIYLINCGIAEEIKNVTTEGVSSNTNATTELKVDASNNTTTEVPVANITSTTPTTTTTSSTTTTTTTTTTSTTTPKPTTVTTTTSTAKTSELPSSTASTTASKPETTEKPKTSTETISKPENLVSTEAPKVPNVTVSAPENLASTEAPKNATTVTPKAESLTTTAKTTTEKTTTEKPKQTVVLGPEVTVESGNVRPAVLHSRKGRKYYAFKAIPFAAPPVQYQRFKDPQRYGKWEGTLNATEYGPSCVQYNVLTDEIEGEEDCLHLNVFTPKLKLDKRNGDNTGLPVMVFFHQGAFMFGSSKDYEAKYLMDEDVVLVTVNYRLGAFGFLNTEGDSEALGNMGLKDQNLALHWVQENIHFFNGEKNLVTIIGESAGGASVHYHLLSERSKRLFSRAISMSGTALSPWAFVRTPRKNAKKLGTMMNCPTTDMYELFICLQGKDARAIAQKQKEFFEWSTDPIAPFGPSVEVHLDEQTAFIRDTPYALISKGQINDQPWMLGVVEDVCLLDAYSVLIDPQLVADMNQDWHRVAPLTFSFRDTAFEPDAVSNQIRAFYFGGKEIGNDTARELVNLYSDRWFNHATRTAAVLHGQKNEAVPLFLYMFSYQGKESHLKFFNITAKLGVSEGDELQYLFNMNNRFGEIMRGDVDEDLSDKFIKLWLSFAKNGHPTDTWNGPQWQQMTPEQVKGDEALMFYKIDTNCSFIDEPFASRMSFWDNLPLNEMDHEIENPYGRHGLTRQSEADEDFPIV